MEAPITALADIVPGLYEQKNTASEVKWGNDDLVVTGTSMDRIVRIRLEENADSMYSVYGIAPGMQLDAAQQILTGKGFVLTDENEKWMTYSDGNGVEIMFRIKAGITINGVEIRFRTEEGNQIGGARVGKIYLATNGYMPLPEN